MTMSSISQRSAHWFLRLSLALGLLSAVADRLGLWGVAGSPNVAWGNMQNFIRYTGTLCPWCPTILLPSLAWIVTATEMILGFGLIAGVAIRRLAVMTFALTAIFAISMTYCLGIHAPLNYSVFAFSAAALCLATEKPEGSHAK